MPPISQNGAIFSFNELATETITILQLLMNFFDNDPNTNVYLKFFVRLHGEYNISL